MIDLFYILLCVYYVGSNLIALGESCGVRIFYSEIIRVLYLPFYLKDLIQLNSSPLIHPLNFAPTNVNVVIEIKH